MTAYAAVISLQNTIEHILHSFRMSLIPPSREIIQVAYKELEPLQRLLKRLDRSSKSRSRSKVNASDRRLKEILWRFEDLLESILSYQLISQFQTPHPDQLTLRTEIDRRTKPASLQSSRSGSGSKARSFKVQKEDSRTSAADQKDIQLFCVDLRRLKNDVDSFVRALKDMEKEYVHELEHLPEDEDEDEDEECVLSMMTRKSKMVGLSDQFKQFKNDLLEEHHWKQMYGLVGMAGVGKTALAKRIYADPKISTHFDCRAWITVTRTPQANHVSPRAVLAQLDPAKEADRNQDQDQDQDKRELKKRLEGKKCLIVVDDVWEPQPLIPLISTLSEIQNGTVRVLLTSRERNVIAGILPASTWSSVHAVVRFLDEEESKDLLCRNVFGKESCPPHLDRAATKIAKKCEGLPLLIGAVSHHVWKSQSRELEYWEDVAEMRNPVFNDAYDQISKVLYPSYDYLSQHLKPLFLFLGAFPPEYDIPPSKILNMLTAEGWFVDTNQRNSLKLFVLKCLKELCTVNHLVLFTQKSIFWHAEADGDDVIKTCRLHSCWRYLCRGEARKNKLFLVSDRIGDASEQDVVRGQRCLCLHNNILFAIKQFSETVRQNCAYSARSLLFFGPYHQYPISFNVGFKLLRELDALKLRFYAFPTEILALVRLKYLALTCNGEVPAEISKLLNLRILIIHPHICTRRFGAPSYLPVQIWDMQSLEHIEVLGKSLLPPPPLTSRELAQRNVSTLVGVNSSISTVSDLSKRIPNVRKLGVAIELTPHEYEASSLLSCFGRISELASLETLKCSIVNPVVVLNNKKGSCWSSSPSSALMVPRGLRKLHLSGMGLPWRYMDSIGSLPFLQVLKLRCYAFRGPKWEAKGHSFSGLKYLLIEDSDVVEWKPKGGSFPKLVLLSLKHCYRLEEVRWPSNARKGKIELEECNPLAVACAERLELQINDAARLKVTATDDYQQD